MAYRLDKHITGDHYAFASNYYGDSKTSRTMADADELKERENATKKAVSAVIRKPHKIHKRNKKRKISYF